MKYFVLKFVISGKGGIIINISQFHFQRDLVRAPPQVPACLVRLPARVVLQVGVCLEPNHLEQQQQHRLDLDLVPPAQGQCLDSHNRVQR